MAQKNNIRSIRFSDEIADLIDRQSGETFTQKFENLVTRCAWELLNKYNTAVANLHKIVGRIESLETAIDQAINEM